MLVKLLQNIKRSCVTSWSSCEKFDSTERTAASFSVKERSVALGKRLSSSKTLKMQAGFYQVPKSKWVNSPVTIHAATEDSSQPRLRMGHKYLQEQVESGLVVLEVDAIKVDTFLRVFRLLVGENVIVEVKLELLVCNVDAQLLDAVVLEVFETEYI
jgi:hypothetical protein